VDTQTTARGLRRVEQVIKTFAKHGLDAPELARCGDWRCRAAIVWHRLHDWRGPRTPWPLAVRNAMIELGPGFIKLGQVMSVRSDKIPQEYAEALKGLQEDVPPVPFAEIRLMIESELGAPLELTFEEFDRTPLAAGSVAQVYLATLRSGRQVAVKVRRPGIEDLLNSDMEVVTWIAKQIEHVSLAARRLHLADAALELARYSRRELDFRIEGQITMRVRKFFESWAEVRIPEVILARPGLLVMEYFAAFPITDLASLERYGIDRDGIVRTAARAVLAQIYDLGVFHGDPHPGNVHVTPDGKLVFLDFGIAGELSAHLRHCMLESALHAARGEIDRSLAYLLEIVTPEPNADLAGFSRDITKRLQAWSGASSKEYGFGQLVYDQVSLGAAHGFRFPPDSVLFTKALLTLEGVVLQLSPDLSLSNEAIPFFESLARREYSWSRLGERLARALPDWIHVLETEPTARLRMQERWRNTSPTSGDEFTTMGGLAPTLFGGFALVTGGMLLGSPTPVSGHLAAVLGSMLVVTGLLAGLRGLRR
jgi:ubiquinone biosynthesis protein